MAAQRTSGLSGPTRMMSRFLVVSAEPSSWGGQKYRRGWIGQARTTQMAFAVDGVSAGGRCGFRLLGSEGDHRSRYCGTA